MYYRNLVPQKTSINNSLINNYNPVSTGKNGEGLGLGRAGTPVGVVVGMDTAVQHRTIPSIDDSRQATLCA
jgi:hypothetical protein